MLQENLLLEENLHQIDVSFVEALTTPPLPSIINTLVLFMDAWLYSLSPVAIASIIFCMPIMLVSMETLLEHQELIPQLINLRETK